MYTIWFLPWFCPQFVYNFNEQNPFAKYFNKVLTKESVKWRNKTIQTKVLKGSKKYKFPYKQDKYICNCNSHLKVTLKTNVIYTCTYYINIKSKHVNLEKTLKPIYVHSLVLSNEFNVWKNLTEYNDTMLSSSEICSILLR